MVKTNRPFEVVTNLQNYKDKYNLSNRKLAKTLRVNPVFISKIFGGYSNMRVDTINRIANTLGVSIESLLYTKIEF